MFSIFKGIMFYEKGKVSILFKVLCKHFLIAVMKVANDEKVGPSLLTDVPGGIEIFVNER